MPSRKKHEQFDEYLALKGVLMPDGRYAVVHSFMDKGVNCYGADHRNLDFYHQEEGLRSWINGKYNVIGQNLATDWLRAGLGHICLDYKDSSIPADANWDIVFHDAFQLMNKMKWTRSRFIRQIT